MVEKESSALCILQSAIAGMGFNMMKLWLVVALLGGVALGCASGGSSGSGTERGVASDSSPLPTAQTLLGEWSLATDPPMQRPGLQLRITIDSAQGSSFFGRLTFYFSGDVGGDPDAFEPFVGTVDRDGGVSYTIRQRDPTMLGIAVVGRLQADTILADTFVIGPDTVTTMPGRNWFFVKEKR
jgi:hypothetical protein